MNYLITWEIEVEAESPFEAAIEAAQCQADQTAWDPEFTGVFTVVEKVNGEEGRETLIDLEKACG